MSPIATAKRAAFADADTCPEPSVTHDQLALLHLELSVKCVDVGDNAARFAECIETVVGAPVAVAWRALEGVMGSFQRFAKTPDIISLDALRDALPDYAKDIRINLNAVMSDTLLAEQSKWGAMVAAAHASGCWALYLAIDTEAQKRLTAEALSAAKSAAAVMAMNNVYYRGLHLMQNEEYTSLRTGLRMSVTTNPGVDRGDFEFWCFVASAVNGCGKCLDAHEEELRKRDWQATHVQAGLKIAAILSATAAVVRAEAG